MDEVNEEEGCYYTTGHLVWRDAASETKPAGFPAQVSLETEAFSFSFWSSIKTFFVW